MCLLANEIRGLAQDFLDVKMISSCKRRMSGELLKEHLKNKTYIKEKFIRALIQFDFNLICVKTSIGYNVLTPSAKEANKWQITYLNDEEQPTGDAGTLNKEDAISLFLSEIPKNTTVDDLCKHFY